MTTSQALVEALRHLGARRVAVASPYEPWLNDYLKRYLERSGFAVTGIAGFGTQEHARCSPEETIALARRVVTPEAEAVLISCTNFRTASLWRLLGLAGGGDPIPGAGRLLDETRT